MRYGTSQNTFRLGIKTSRNKTGTSKVGTISEAQEAQRIEIVLGGLFGLFENPVSCKISKNLNIKKMKGYPLETEKFRRKEPYWVFFYFKLEGFVCFKYKHLVRLVKVHHNAQKV